MPYQRTDSERLAIIETMVTDIKQRLFGNGQPGEIDQLHERIGANNKRLARLENWRWWVLGIAAGLGMAAGGAVSQVIGALLK